MGKRIYNPQGFDITNYVNRNFNGTQMFNTSIGTNSQNVRKTTLNQNDTPLGQRDNQKK